MFFIFVGSADAFGFIYKSSFLFMYRFSMPSQIASRREARMAKAIETGMILSIMDMKKTTFMCFFHRSIFTETREFANHCFMEVSYKLWL